MSPAIKCNNGKWKWGEYGECSYDSQQDAEDDNADYYRDIVGYLVTDGIELPLFKTIEEAEEEAERLGGSGFHEHTIDGEIYYMPFESHAEAINILNPKQDNLEEEVENDNNDSNEIEFKSKVVNIWDEKYDNSMEKRLFNVESRVEQTEEGKEIVKGHASVYDSRSEFMGFYEYIAPGTFTQELIDKSDVRALINHDANLVLARSKNGEGTLKLFADERGLAFEYELPETSYGKDLGINLKNGNISQSSFAFTVSPNGDEWSTDEEGNDVRTITKIDRLFDISQVTYAAYSQAESDLVVAQRGLQVYKEKKRKQTEEQDFVLRSLAKLKIELKKRK